MDPTRDMSFDEWKDDVRGRVVATFSGFDLGPSTYLVTGSYLTRHRRYRRHRMVCKVVILSCSCGIRHDVIWLRQSDERLADDADLRCPSGPALLIYSGRFGSTFVESTIRWRTSAVSCPKGR